MHGVNIIDGCQVLPVMEHKKFYHHYYDASYKKCLAQKLLGGPHEIVHSGQESVQQSDVKSIKQLKV